MKNVLDLGAAVRIRIKEDKQDMRTLMHALIDTLERRHFYYLPNK